MLTRFKMKTAGFLTLGLLASLLGVVWGSHVLSALAALPLPLSPAYAWGNNSEGELGDSTNTNQNTPIAVRLPNGVTGFTAIAVGSFHSLGLGSDGKLYAWGYNSNGQLGDGTNTNRNVPVLVTLPNGVTSFSAFAAGGSHSLGLGNNGKLYAWGYNSEGQLGDGTNTSRNTPGLVALPNGVTSFSLFEAGGSHSLGLGNNGKLYAWGYNSEGQLGDGTNTGRNTPGLVTLPNGVTSFSAFSAGDYHNLGLGNDGKLYGWGYNGTGELGDGTTLYRTIPVQVTLPNGVTGFTTFVAGGAHSLALGNDGKLYSWGYNAYGQLGDGTNISRNTAGLVTLPNGVTSFSGLAAGGTHSLGVGNNGKLYAWGRNSQGQLADGTNTNRFTPVLVQLPAGASSFSGFAAGGFHTLALVRPLDPTATALTSSPNPASYGSSVTFTATVMPITATGTVSFTFGTGQSTITTTATLANGIATYMTNTLQAGIYTITARYGGDANYQASNSQQHTQVICNPQVVTHNQDDGQATTCGTLSYALATTTQGTISFALAQSSTITFTGSLTPTLAAGVTLDGGVNEIVLEGNGVTGNGLRLGGNNQITNLTIRHFGGQELVAIPGASPSHLYQVKLES